MPTLHWIGKEKVINHHMDVPFKVLEHAYNFDNGKQTAPFPLERAGGVVGNKIIHGDNLEALKALLPEYEGKIKCIYIDPPYNTGNEGWVYNDNMTDPKIKKWLGQVVGKESEDLSRHDQWLCMMYPRLKLLHKLLAEDGAIFISIDDIDVNHLRLVLNEIFGSNSFISQLIWKSRKSEDARAKTGVSNDHEYVICYGKNSQIKFLGVDKDLTKFSNPDNDFRGTWRIADITGLATKEQRPNLHYDLIDSKTGLSYPPPNKGWRFEVRTMAKKMSEGRVIFPANPDGRPRQKMFLGETVLNLNKQDGGNRKFILIEMEDYAETITAERVKRVINGYGDKAGTGGSFDYFELGQPLFIEAGVLNELVGVEKIRAYIWYSETKQTMSEPEFTELENLQDRGNGTTTISENSGNPVNPDSAFFLGKYNDTAYYFNYAPDRVTTLNHTFLSTMKTKAEQYVVYADNCLLTKEYDEASSDI